MRSSTLHTHPRSGIVLIVVLILLTLFAIVGISFVYLSDKEATNARYYADANIRIRPDMDLIGHWGLSQFVFDTANNGSALQGAGLSSGMYGISGNVPYSGLGRLRGPDPLLSSAVCGLFKEDLPNFYLRGGTYSESVHGPRSVPYTYPDNNHAWLAGMDGNGSVLRRSFVRGPIKLQRSDGFIVNFDPLDTRPQNPPYTLFSTTGHIPFVAFWRRSPVPGDPTLGWTTVAPLGLIYRPPQPVPPPGVNWIDIVPAQARAMTFRPGTWDHINLVGPDDPGGDVKNLPPGTAGTDIARGITTPWYGNDSIWIDLGFPVQEGADGRRYKPLFAFSIIDLDNKINLNATANVWGTTAVGGLPGMSTSNQGFGSWEVNLFRLLNYGPAAFPGAGPTEGIQVFQGKTTTPMVQGRYGLGAATTALLPNPFFSLWPTRTAYYGRFDADAANELLGYSPATPYRLPGYDVTAGDTLNYDRFPRFAPQVGGPGFGYGAGSTAENQKALVGPFHPLAYAYFSPQGTNAVFPVSNMEALLRHGDTGADSLTSDFRRLLLNNMMALRLRRQVTAHSADLERVGAMPYWHGDQSAYVIPPALGGAPRDLPPATTPPVPSLPAGASGEFSATGRSLAALLGRIDLNRLLPEYPRLTDSVNTVTITGMTMGTVGGRIGDAEAFRHATAARQDLAADVFRRLLAVTGGEDGLGAATPPLPTEKINMLRYLAQLSVNIVDFRDYDDYHTPFNFGATLIALYPNLAADTTLSGTGPGYSNWVFGVELPKLVLNEAFAQYDDPGMSPDADINIWLELYNTQHRDQAALEVDPDDRFQAAYGYGGYNARMPAGGVRLHMPETTAGAGDGYGIYRVIMAQNGTNMRNLDNVRGDVIGPGNGILNYPVGMATAPAIMDNWTSGDWDPATLPNTDYVFPSNDNHSGARKLPMMSPTFDTAVDKGFYLLGPMTDFPGTGGMGVYPPPPTATLQRPHMTIRRTAGSAGEPFTVVLQRLACPHLPPDPSPTLIGGAPNPLYNPYISVDYVEGVPTHNTGSIGIGARYSIGKSQPYAARRSAGGVQANLKNQTPDPAPPGGARSGQPQHTFLRINSVEEVNYTRDVDPLIIDYNGDDVAEPPSTAGVGMTPQTLKLPHDWLVHLDRDLISPMELLQVSTYKPHELTQQFMVDLNSDGDLTDANEPFQQHVDWFDRRTAAGSTNRLYRIFDYLQVRNRMAGTSQVTIPTLAVIQPDPANAPGYYEFTVPTTAWFYPGATPAGPGLNGGLWQIVPGVCMAASTTLGAASTSTAVRVVSTRPGPMGTTVPTPVTPTTFTVFLPPGLRPGAGIAFTSFTLTYLDGRVPGKVNINTVTDIEVFRSLCDASPGNAFNPPLPFPIPAVPAPPPYNLPAGTTSLIMPAGSPVAFAAGAISGNSHGVNWTVGAGSFLEFNDPIDGRETVIVTGPIVDASGTGAGPFTIPITAVDANLTPIPGGTQLRHHRYPGNPFPIAVDNVSTTFVKLVAARDGTLTGVPRPFIGFSAGGIAAGDTQYPNGFGIQDTFFRPDPTSATGAGLFENIGGVHPQRSHELITKIANNVTTRSNVFAVWMTIGYFEVGPSEDVNGNAILDPGEDANLNGVLDRDGYLGREIGRADGQHVRHRMFAIIDRSQFDPYVQVVDSYIRNITGGEWSYDVSAGAVRNPLLPPPPTWVPNTNAAAGALNVVIPIVGNNQFDPRRPYTAQVSFQNVSTGTVVSSPPITLPPTVLYWSMIE